MIKYELTIQTESRGKFSEKKTVENNEYVELVETIRHFGALDTISIETDIEENKTMIISIPKEILKTSIIILESEVVT